MVRFSAKAKPGLVVSRKAGSSELNFQFVTLHFQLSIYRASGTDGICMQVTKGYKQTEIGVIPEDWETPELGEILTSTQLGGNYKNNKCKTNSPLIKMGNLGRGSIKLDKLEFIDRSQSPSSRDLLFEDDILFNTRNTLDLVGKVAIWRKELHKAYFNSNIMRMKFEQSRVSSYKFMNYILNTPKALSALRAIATGTTSVAAIYGRDLMEIKLPLPTKAEQEAIAEALSDTDAWIESLEQLIVKKRRIKAGSMQALLTGKQRLPGFETKPGSKQTEVGVIPNDWDVTEIGQVTRKVTTGKLDANAMCKDGAYRFYTCAKKHYQIDHYAFDCEALLVSGNGANVGYIHYYKGKFNAYQRTYVLSDFEVSIKFLQHYLGQKLKERIDVEVKAGSTPYITRGVITKMKIPQPPTKAEQTAIAAILSDMDTELDALEAKLRKAHQIKQGMMQELLTGKTRLVTPASNG
jgi:type I restriction enzyme S subunit